MLLKYKSIDELEKSIQIQDLSKYKTRMIVNAMKNLLQIGKNHLLNDSKEDAYSHFYRYMTLMNIVIKTPEYQRNKSAFKNDLSESNYVLEKWEMLQNELIQIYKAHEVLTVPKDEDMTCEEKDSDDADDFLNTPAICLNNIYWIGIDRLIECIKLTKNKFNYIVFDTRSAEEYTASHLYDNSIKNVNIPMNEVPKGISPARLESLLTEESKEKWINRATYNFIILMGSSDTPECLTPAVTTLHDSITKWDPNTNYYHKPIILEGGYMNFCFKYPTYCTAAVTSSFKQVENGPATLLDAIEYPNLDMDTLPPPSDNNLSIVPPVTMDSSPIKQIPDFDRSKKPTFLSNEPSNEPRIYQNMIISDSDAEDNAVITKPPMNATENIIKKQKDIPVEPPEPPTTVIPKESRKKNVYTFLSDNRSTNERSNATLQLPSYDRSKKPKFSDRPASIDLDISRFEPTKRTRDLMPGWTGLQNNSNYCYINSILQILFHLHEFRDYLITGGYLMHVNRSSQTQGKIVDELAAMCKLYWSGEYSTISSKSLKAVVGKINPRFANNTQEDCHEFFMFLLHYLHEELSYRINIPPDASEPEIKFIEYMNHQQSFINKYFFGQSQTRVRCHACHHVSSTYSPLGCLTLEIVGKTLEECINEHYREEEVDDFRCDNCGVKGTVTKQLNIYRTPKYLTIHLKRFKGAGLRCYHKKLDRLGFPLRLVLPTVVNNVSSVANYDLIGICIHSGSLDSGHYKSYIDVESNNNWIVFDDSRITTLGSLLNHIRSTTRDVYMLFYKISPVPDACYTKLWSMSFSSYARQFKKIRVKESPFSREYRKKIYNSFKNKQNRKKKFDKI